jgi:hypothetical protein
MIHVVALKMGTDPIFLKKWVPRRTLNASPRNPATPVAAASRSKI